MVNATFLDAYPIALRAAKTQAMAAVSSGIIPASDREDFEQEGVVACLRALPRFDPARASLRTFIERVVAARLASLVRQARRRPETVPVDMLCWLPVECKAARRELRMSIDRVVANLRTDDRELVQLLCDISPAEASRRLGIPSSTLHDRILRLRRRFTRAGLDRGDYRAAGGAR